MQSLEDAKKGFPIVSDSVESNQVAIAFKHLRRSTLAILLNIVILSLMMWKSIDTSFILIWGSLHGAVTLWRLYSYYRFKNQRDRYSYEEWKKRFILGMVLSASLWGVASWVLFPVGKPLEQGFLIVILAGISAGSVGSLSSIRNSAQIYLSLILVPLIGILIYQNDSQYFYFIIVLMTYWILLLGVARRIHQNVTEALESRLLYQAALSELKLSEERFETIFKEAPAGIFYYDRDLIVIDSNNEFLNILQISRKMMTGLDMKVLPDKSLNEALWNAVKGEKGYYEGPYTSMIKQLNLWIILRTTPMYDSQRNIIGGVGLVTDITERIAAEEKIKHQAYFDPLTDIPNRILLKDRIERALTRFRRHQNYIAVMFLDLDHFKSINDSLGHHVGDSLLIETAMRLVSVCREGDTVSRLGGDEFVVLLSDLGNDPHNAAKKAEIVAEKIHEVLALPFDVGTPEPIMTSSSIGISLVGSSEQSADDLIKFADTAMYQAKKEGRNTTRFYQEQMDQWIRKRLYMENSLRYAVKNGELELYYQPVIEIETKKIIGAEALLRWNHPELGMVMPDEMIDIAEESGLIVPIGEWVLKQACTQFVTWKKSSLGGDRVRRIAVNVSAIQFRQNDFVDKVISIVSESGIDPQMVEIELTESTVIDKIDEVAEKIRRLREFGIGISMDDFGTGYSSLAYLKRLPFTTLKIDRSFVRDIMSDKDDAALVETILSMASIFNLDVIAEGVETIEQFVYLQRHGCAYFQGYLCSKPVKVDSFEELLKHEIQYCQMTG